MSSVDKTHKFVKVKGRERRKSRVDRDIGRGDVGEVRMRSRAPVVNAPRFSGAKVADNMLQGIGVTLGGGLGVTAEERDDIANVKATHDEGINEFTKYLAVTKASSGGEGEGVRSAFGRTSGKAEGRDDGRRHGNNVVAVTGVRRGSGPTVSLEQSINVGLAGDLDVVTGLMDINAIILTGETLGGSNTGNLVISSDLSINESDERGLADAA